MFHKQYRFYLLLVVLLAGVLMLSACGDDDDGGAPLQAVDRVPTDTPIPADSGSPLAGVQAPQPDVMELPAIEDLPGRLVFTRSDNLYLAGFDGEAVTEIAESVYGALVSVSPDGRYVVYSPGEAVQVGSMNTTRNSHVLRLTDLTTMDTNEYIPEQIVPRALMVMGWMPDNATAVAWDSTARAVVLLGPDNITQVPISGPLVVGWTGEGHLITADQKPGTEGESTPVGTYFRVDPATQEREALDFTLTANTDWDFFNLESEFIAQGVQLADTFTELDRTLLREDGIRVLIPYPEEMQRRGVHLCETWEIVERAPDESTAQVTLTSLEDTTYLSDLRLLPDGSLLFLRWWIEGCDMMGDMKLDLMRLPAGADTPETLAEGLDPGSQGNFNAINELSLVRGRKLAVSPDGRYVAWVSGGWQSGTSAIQIADLETGVQATVLQMRVAPQDAEGSIESLFWVPE